MSIRNTTRSFHHLLKHKIDRGPRNPPPPPENQSGWFLFTIRLLCIQAGIGFIPVLTWTNKYHVRLVGLAFAQLDYYNLCFHPHAYSLVRIHGVLILSAWKNPSEDHAPHSVNLRSPIPSETMRLSCLDHCPPSSKNRTIGQAWSHRPWGNFPGLLYELKYPQRQNKTSYMQWEYVSRLLNKVNTSSSCSLLAFVRYWKDHRKLPFLTILKE